MRTLLHAVITDFRRRYHSMHPKHEPVYIGELPGWRFTRLLEETDELVWERQRYNAATGDGLPHPPGTNLISADPEIVAADYQRHVPDTLTPTITAIWDGEAVRYRTPRLSWTDPVPQAFEENTELRQYKGTIHADRHTASDIRDRCLVPPGAYSLVASTDITDDANTTVPQLLQEMDDVRARIPESLYARRNGDVDYRGWAAGEDASRYWEQYIADDLHVLAAEAAVEETSEMQRYGLRVEGVPQHRYTGQDEGLVIRFWSETDKTGEGSDAFADLL